jgi:hypothetical protein
MPEAASGPTVRFHMIVADVVVAQDAVASQATPTPVRAWSYELLPAL